MLGIIATDAVVIVIKGISLKCITCFDYDLCESCDQAHKHDHQAMIRIVLPDDHSWLLAWFFAETPMIAIPPTDSSQESSATGCK